MIYDESIFTAAQIGSVQMAIAMRRYTIWQTNIGGGTGYLVTVPMGDRETGYSARARQWTGM